jgi:hypothetical protein
MATKLDHPDLPFYLGWVAFSTLAILLAFGGTFVVLGLATDWIGDWVVVGGTRHITEDYMFSFVFPPLIWLFTCGLQVALLRRYLSKMSWWFLATGVGWLLTVAVFYLAAQILDRNLLTTTTNAVVFGLVGISIGLVQWMLLRRRLSQTAWWILASALGWGMTGLVVGPTFTNPLEILSIGFFPGLTTAVCWGYLFNQSVAPRNSEEKI